MLINNGSFFRKCSCASQEPVARPNPTQTYGPPDNPPPKVKPWKDRAKAEGSTKIPRTNNISLIALNQSFFRYTYIWLDDNSEFWAKPLFIDDYFLYCWVWNGREWLYYRILFNYINTFMLF